VTQLTNLLREYGTILLTVLILSLIFAFVESRVPAERGQAISKRLFNIVYYPFVLALTILGQVLIGPLHSRALGVVGGGLLPELINRESGFLAQVMFALFYAVLFDFWQYWAHRLQHASSILWETHKFHHSETALNSSTIARVHLLSNLLFIILFLPVLLVIGPQTPHFIALFLMFKLWGFVNHTNVRLNLGPLTAVISGPQWHRLHHSLYAEHQDKNFAAFFPFIDMLFGTYYRPRENEYPPTGLRDAESESYLHESTISPLSAWYKMTSKRLAGFSSDRTVRKFSPAESQDTLHN